MVGYRLPFRFWDNLSPHSFALAWSIVLSLPYFTTNKRKLLLFATITFYTLFLLSNVWYFRTYYTSIPLVGINQLNNLDGLLPSILASLRLKDVLLITPMVLILALYLSYFKRYSLNLNTKVCYISSLGSLFVITAFAGLQVYLHKENVTFQKRLQAFTIDKCQAARDYGIFSVLIWQINDMVVGDKPLTASEKEKIDEWLLNNMNQLNQSSESAELSKNVIIVYFESLESWVLESKVGNQEITPNLNKLINAKNTVYAPYMVPQTKDGRSSDAQFILNTGILPLNSGAVFLKYPKTDYYSLAKALKEHKNYTTVTMVGDEPSFWNQGEMNPSLGYDYLYSSLEFNVDEEIGLGMSDESFFKQSSQKIKALPQPFMAQLITLTSHLPFKLPKDKIQIDVPATVPNKLADYIESINYTDRALGYLLKELEQTGLMANTMLVVIGDHEAFGKEQRKQLVLQNNGSTQFSAEPFTPFIVVNAPKSLNYKKVMGQIDIYPTLLDLLGVKYEWFGIGKSIMSGHKPSFAITSDLRIIGDTSLVPLPKVKALQDAWPISDIIIRKKYFNYYSTKLIGLK